MCMCSTFVFAPHETCLTTFKETFLSGRSIFWEVVATQGRFGIFLSKNFFMEIFLGLLV